MILSSKYQIRKTYNFFLYSLEENKQYGEMVKYIDEGEGGMFLLNC